MTDRPVVWSFGGGTQSVAIAVLVAEGRLPKPERVVIADTGREASETWEYTREHVDPLLRTVGLEVETASHDLATVDLYSTKGKLLLPVFTGDGGALTGFCSNEWKKRVIGRWCRAQGYGPKKPLRMWIGISVDEIQRAKPSGVGWMEYHWPLLFDLPTRRDECVAIVEGAGLPTPPRSSCWMCPYRSSAEWRHLRDSYPDDFEKAKKLEADIQEKDRDGRIYLTRTGVDLADAPLDSKQGELFDQCDSGFCFV